MKSKGEVLERLRNQEVVHRYEQSIVDMIVPSDTDGAKNHSPGLDLPITPVRGSVFFKESTKASSTTPNA